MKKSSYAIITIGIVIFIVFFLSLKKEDQTILNLFALSGTYASVIGVIVAFDQILSLRKTTQLIKSAVEQNSERIRRVLSISDISKSIKVVEQIQLYLRTDKMEPALIRMQDLKAIIIQANDMEELKEISSKYTEVVTVLSTDLNNLSANIRDGRKKIDLKIVNNNLEEILTILMQFENKLKSNNYDIT